MTLKEIRNDFQLSQLDAAAIVGIPVRTYRRYESNDEYGDKLKRKMFMELIKQKCEITEDKGKLTIDEIKNKLTELFDSEYKNQIDFCYLFGSYAKKIEKENSDVDLYVSTTLTGFAFVGLVERIREVLHKRIDLIRSNELKNNIDLVNQIMKDGVKIYG